MIDAVRSMMPRSSWSPTHQPMVRPPTILTPDGKLARVVAGQFELAHRAGCLVVDEFLSAEVGEPYDVLIASAGGYPLDIDLRQAHKGLENACRALKPGGSILFFAECPNGSGHPSFDDYVTRYRDDIEMKQALMQHFEVGGHKAYWVARLGRVFDIHLVSALPPDFVESCHLHPVAPEAHAARLRELMRPGLAGRCDPARRAHAAAGRGGAGGGTMMSRRSLVLGATGAALGAAKAHAGAQTNAWTIDPKDLNSLLQVLAAMKRLGFEGFETSFRNVQAQFDQPQPARDELKKIGPAILRSPRFPAGVRSADVDRAVGSARDRGGWRRVLGRGAADRERCIHARCGGAYPQSESARPRRPLLSSKEA